MPYYPQTQNSLLVEYATVKAQTAGYTALAGDIVLYPSTSAGAHTVTLPAVTTGGPVGLINCQTAAGTVTVVSAETSGVDITTAAGGAAVAGTTGVGVAGLKSATYVSDGASNWYQVY